jgi:hypothetical protein
VVDGVPQLIMISSAVGGDRLPCSISYCILVSGLEGWSLVLAEHIGSTDDLHYCLILFSARARNSLDSEFWWSGDVDVVQQIPQSASGDRDSSPKVLILSVSWNISSFSALLQGVCHLLLLSHCALPLASHGRGSVASVELLASLPLSVL